MDHSASMFRNILSVDLLDVINIDQKGNNIICRMIVLGKTLSCIVLEPVLDYLNDDTIISGIATSYIERMVDDQLKSLLIDRQKIAGYRSPLWKWERYLLENRNDVSVNLGNDNASISSISISSRDGNLILRGLLDFQITY